MNAIRPKAGLPAITRRLFNISFPRSGHHFVEHTLRGYFGDAFVYCDSYVHCNRAPCPDASTNFQKNHDQWLNLPMLAGERYLILFRHPYPALQSWFDLYLEMGWLPPALDTIETWNQWFEGGLTYWQRLIERWAINGPDGRMMLSYEDLMADPAGRIAEIVALMAPDGALDLKRIAAVLDRGAGTRYMPDMARAGKRPFASRNFEHFRYYDPADLARANACVEALPKYVLDVSPLVRAPLAARSAAPVGVPRAPRYAAADPGITFAAFPEWDSVRSFVETTARMRPGLYAEMVKRAPIHFHLLPVLVLPTAALDGATRDCIELLGGRLITVVP